MSTDSPSTLAAAQNEVTSASSNFAIRRVGSGESMAVELNAFTPFGLHALVVIMTHVYVAVPSVPEDDMRIRLDRAQFQALTKIVHNEDASSPMAQIQSGLKSEIRGKINAFEREEMAALRTGSERPHAALPLSKGWDRGLSAHSRLQFS